MDAVGGQAGAPAPSRRTRRWVDWAVWGVALIGPALLTAALLQIVGPDKIVAKKIFLDAYLYLGLVCLVAAARGLWPALLCAVVSAGFIDRFLYPWPAAAPADAPAGTASPTLYIAFQEIMNLVIFVTMAVLVGGLTSWRRRALLKSRAMTVQLSDVNAELTNARAELIASRARVLMASDETRRRIERDLHDGVQQGLVTVALDLRSALDGDLTQTDLQAQVARAEQQLQGLLEEVREISRGVYPAILTEAGLASAVKALARRSAVPVELDLRLAGRLPTSIEAAAYYTISEALANTAKYANASVAKVTVERRNGSLRIQIADNGAGGADPVRGSGLLGLTDRVQALGGTIAISSPANGGTTIVAELPAGV